MYAHHQRVIDTLTAEMRADPRYLALLVGGSIAKGRARPDSDVDLILVVTDDEFARCLAAGEIQYFNKEIADWPGGYVEGKIVNWQFLLDVADHGSEPARSAFVSARIGFSHLPDLPEVLVRITAYPEPERAAKLGSFNSQVQILNWFVPEAEKRQDAYLLAWASSNMVLYGGRLILAHNRILFPYHKWFMTELRQAPDKPADFLERAEALLAHPGHATAQAFHDCLAGFQDWGITMRQAVLRFTLDSEWNWRAGRPPLADW